MTSRQTIPAMLNWRLHHRWGITATVPSANVSIPGYYMLFLVDSNGAPSVAKWIHVGWC